MLTPDQLFALFIVGFGVLGAAIYLHLEQHTDGDGDESESPQPN